MTYILLGVILSYPKKKERVRYPLVGNLLYQVIFFSNLMVPLSHRAVSTSDVTVLLLHSTVLLFFFSHLMVPSSHCAVPISHVTVLLSYLIVPLFISYIWRFHPHILQFQHHMWQFFCHIWWFFYFFSHLPVLSSHYVVPTSYLIILSSHLVVLLIFLTFEAFILTLCSTNIICNSSFVTFGGSLFFLLHIWEFHSHIVQF